MRGKMPEILTVEDVAQILRSRPEAIIQELVKGTLRGFQVGGEWRIANPDVLSFIGAPSQGEPLNRRDRDRTDLFRDFDIEWNRTGAFSYRWPSRADEPAADEDYPDAFEGLIYRRGRVRRGKKLLIGFTIRNSAGMDRRRATVFLARNERSSDTTLYPIVEFAGANDFETTRRLASVIKLRNRRQLQPGDPLPSEYAEFETAVYSDVVTGPYASNGMAVVVREDDLDAIARHALIRLRWSRMGHSTGSWFPPDDAT